MTIKESGKNFYFIRVYAKPQGNEKKKFVVFLGGLVIVLMMLGSWVGILMPICILMRRKVENG